MIGQTSFINSGTRWMRAGAASLAILVAAFGAAWPASPALAAEQLAAVPGFPQPIPAAGAEFTVYNTDDSGPGSFREAILDANSGPGLDTITFSIGSGVATISPQSPLPTITDPVLIDGTTQPGFSGRPLIELNGSGAGPGPGLGITAGGSRVRGLVIDSFAGDGIFLSKVGGNVLDDNYVGTDVTGTSAQGNEGNGIVVAAPNNTIGGTTAGARNVIAGNNDNGVYIVGADAVANRVQGNYIGVDADGAAGVGNGGTAGVLIIDAPNNAIGGTEALARNLISGNHHGIYVSGKTATGNLVQGNFIGTDASGGNAIGNMPAHGVVIDGASNNTVGGTAAGARNVISGNGFFGVEIRAGFFAPHDLATGNLIQGNFIGTDVTGTVALANGAFGVAITNTPNNTVGGTTPAARNIISGNAQAGILIWQGGSTGNLVEGNHIGTDVNGTFALGNAVGVNFTDASNNTLGGVGADARNLISGNRGTGVTIGGQAASANAVQGNWIGLAASGTEMLGNTGGGVHIFAAANNLIGGTAAGTGNVISGNGLDGVSMGNGALGNRLQGNFIGTDPSGRFPMGNHGVGVGLDGASNSTIGGAEPAARNIISGNDHSGIFITGALSSGNLIQGNYVGTDVAGNAPLGNSPGATFSAIAISGQFGVPSGTVLRGNVISGNGFDGVSMGNGADGNMLIGNRIGTNASGTAALGNGAGGVHIDSAHNTLGGASAGEGNVISGNGGFAGVEIAGSGNLVQGNLIGTDATGTVALLRPDGQRQFNGVVVHGSDNLVGGRTPGAGNVIAFQGAVGVGVAPNTAATRNAIVGNSIFANGGLGIDLGMDGVTANDRGDADVGPNNLQNFPMLTKVVATPKQLVVVGSIDTPNPQTVAVDIYANAVPSPGADPSGFGEGKVFLGTATPNPEGRFTLLAPAVSRGTVISATATDAAGNTSEFGLDVAAAGP